MRNFPSNPREWLRASFFLTKIFLIALACLLVLHDLPFTNDHIGTILICYLGAIAILVCGGIFQIFAADKYKGRANLIFGLLALPVLGLLLPPFQM